MLPPWPSAADGSNGAGWENALGRNPSRIVFLGFNLMTHVASAWSLLRLPRCDGNSTGQDRLGVFRTAWPNKGHWRKQITPKAPGHPRSKGRLQVLLLADQPLEKAPRWRSRARAAPLSSTIQARAFAPIRLYPRHDNRVDRLASGPAADAPQPLAICRRRPWARKAHSMDTARLEGIAGVRPHG
jgi:hypothetical protein